MQCKKKSPGQNPNVARLLETHLRLKQLCYILGIMQVQGSRMMLKEMLDAMRIPLQPGL